MLPVPVYLATWGYGQIGRERSVWLPAVCVATIDCGAGPVQVGSTDDLYAPLVDLKTGREYEPVAWSVKVGDNLFEDALPGASMRHTMKCSYDDGMAVGTVTVKRQCREGGRRDRGRWNRGRQNHHWDRNRR